MLRDCIFPCGMWSVGVIQSNGSPAATVTDTAPDQIQNPLPTARVVPPSRIITSARLNQRRDTFQRRVGHSLHVPLQVGCDTWSVHVRRLGPATSSAMIAATGHFQIVPARAGDGPCPRSVRRETLGALSGPVDRLGQPDRSGEA